MREPIIDRRAQIENQKQQRFLAGLLMVLLFLCLGMTALGGRWYYLHGPCGVARVEESSHTLSNQFQVFNDAFDIAKRTSRIALSGPIAEIQKIKRDTEEIQVPACLEPAKRELMTSIEKSLDGFQAFLAEEADARVAAHLNESVDHMGIFNRTLITVSECAPFCNETE
jgi:hypothetical protein